MPASKLTLKANPTLKDYQEYVAQLIIERGFANTIHDKMILLSEEVGELAKVTRQVMGMKLATDAAEQDAADETADVFIALMAVCNLLGVNLEQAVRDKEVKNKKRTWK